MKKQAKLWAAVAQNAPDETPEEITPVKDKPLCFEVAVTNGEYYFMKFVRNDKGVIDTCLMSSQGMERVGKKIIK